MPTTSFSLHQHPLQPSMQTLQSHESSVSISSQPSNTNVVQAEDSTANVDLGLLFELADYQTSSQFLPPSAQQNYAPSEGEAYYRGKSTKHPQIKTRCRILYKVRPHLSLARILCPTGTRSWNCCPHCPWVTAPTSPPSHVGSIIQWRPPATTVLKRWFQISKMQHTASMCKYICYQLIMVFSYQINNFFLVIFGCHTA